MMSQSMTKPPARGAQSANWPVPAAGPQLACWGDPNWL
jgi:hypothetical protein